MKESLKASVRLQREIIERNFVNKLLMKKDGTGDIGFAAKRNNYGDGAKDAV